LNGAESRLYSCTEESLTYSILDDALSNLAYPDDTNYIRLAGTNGKTITILA